MKKQKLKKAAVLAAVVSTVFAVTACGSKADDSSSKAEKSDTVYRTLQEIKEDGTINIGVFSDKNPFGYVDENGTYQGYDVYFANRIGEDLGVDVNFVSTEAANRIEYLQTGKVDLILANFTVTDERKEEVDFALPYMNVAPATPIKPICIVSHAAFSYMGRYFKRISQSIPFLLSFCCMHITTYFLPCQYI